MVEKIYARPVIPLLISLITGIAAGSQFRDFSMPAYTVVFLFAGIIVYRVKKRKNDAVLPFLLFFVLGYLSILPWVAPGFPDHHIIHYADADKWEVTGTVDTFPFEANNRLKFILQAETLSRKNKMFPVTGKIRVTVSHINSKPSVGDRVVFVSKIRKPRNFNNPGGFNYERYMAFQKVWVTAYVPSDRFAISLKNQKNGINEQIENARRKISDFIDEYDAPGKRKNARGVLKALIVGDRSGIPQSLQAAFNRAGVSHILAISGLHVGIVATASFFIFQWMLSFFKPLLWHAWTRKGAALLSFFPVVSYGLIAGMSPSTQRAVIMVTVFLMTFIFEKEQDLMNTLAIAAMLILIIHPPSLFSVSFQLSFTAVLSIIYGLSRIQIKLSDFSNNGKNVRIARMRQKLATFVFVSLLAVFGTMPLAMFYFNQVSSVGLLANLFLIPLIGFIAVPLGLFSVLLFPVSSYCAKIGIGVSTTVLSWAIDLVRFVADFPFAAVKTVTPSYFEICCFYVFAWALLNLKRAQPVIPASRANANPFDYLRGGHRQFSRFLKLIWESLAAGRKGAILAVIIALMAFCGDAFYWLNKRFRHDDLRVTIIDVGQANAALLELPRGYCLLIDGGGFSDNSIFDVGERILAPLLWRKKIRTVNTLILSHPNSDHLNGLLYIAENFNVGDVWMNDDAPDTLGYKKFLDIIAEKEIRRPRFKDLSRLRKINGVELKILYPLVDEGGKDRRKKWRNPNNNSLVVRVAFGSKSFLFPGDIMSGAERELVSVQGDALKSTVLLAPHHGSITSSTVPFLKKTEPKYTIISSGWNNRFGFPNPAIIKRYKEQGCRIYRTAADGAISIITDGRSIRIEPAVDSAEAG